MKIKEEGQILELDPTKEYIMFVKIGSILHKCIKNTGIRRKNGTIYFVDNMNEFKFVENSDKITDIVFSKGD